MTARTRAKPHRRPTGWLKRQVATSAPSDLFAFQLKAAGVSFEREVKFLPDRKFRLDFTLNGPGRGNVAFEVEGGIWTGGRHVSPTGFLRDLEKYNLLALAGYRLFRVTPQMVKSGEALQLAEQVLGI